MLDIRMSANLNLNFRLGNVHLASTATSDLLCFCNLRFDSLLTEILYRVTLNSVDAED
jgi:hypothetical protein